MSAPPNRTSHLSGTSELTRVGGPRVVDESRGDLGRLYERRAPHCDAVVQELGLDDSATVACWSEESAPPAHDAAERGAGS